MSHSAFVMLFFRFLHINYRVVFRKCLRNVWKKRSFCAQDFLRKKAQKFTPAYSSRMATIKPVE